MARWYPGSLIADIRGTLGSHVYSFEKGTHYIKTACFTPYNPNTLRQTYNRNAYSQMIKHWATITETQRTLWNKFGSLQHPAIPGINCFLRYNLRVIDADHTGLTHIHTPPPYPDTPPRIVGFTVAQADDYSMDIEWEAPSSTSYWITAWYRYKWNWQPGYNLHWEFVKTERSSNLHILHIWDDPPKGQVLAYKLRALSQYGHVSPFTHILFCYKD